MDAAGTAAPTTTGTSNAGGGGTVPVNASSPSHGMPPATPPGGSSPAVDWTSSLPEAQKQFVTQKGFKDTTSIVDSYQNLEKLVGAKEKLIKLPDSFSDPAMGEIYDKLGRPKDGSGYEFATPEGTKANPEFTKFAQELFHKAGLSKTQGEQVANEWNKYAAGLTADSVVKQQAQLDVDKSALTKEWGAAYDQNIKAARAAMTNFNLDAAAVTKIESALGYKDTMKLLQQIGSKVAEDSFVTGQHSGFQGALTPDQAKATFEVKKQDPAWVAKAMSKQQPEFGEYTKLHQYMYPGTETSF